MLIHRSIRRLLERDIRQASTAAGRIYFSSDGKVVPGLNVLKNGKDPEEMKDEDVPEWLWKLADEGNGKSLVEMQRRMAQKREEGGMDIVEMMREAKYLNKLQNRDRIKVSNALRAKK